MKKRAFLYGIAGALLAILALLACRGGPSEPRETYTGTRLQGPAPDFRLTDQQGRAVALSDFRGKVVVLAFLDPECTDVCPLTANEFRLTGQKLGDRATGLVFLVVDVNPEKNSLADVVRATEKWGVQNLTNWHYVTGSRKELEPVYQAYGVVAEGPPKQGKPNELEHTPGAYIIDQAGNKRWYVSTPLSEAGVGASWSGPRLHELLVRHLRELLAAP